MRCTTRLRFGAIIFGSWLYLADGNVTAQQQPIRNYRVPAAAERTAPPTTRIAPITPPHATLPGPAATAASTGIGLQTPQRPAQPVFAGVRIPPSSLAGGPQYWSPTARLQQVRQQLALMPNPLEGNAATSLSQIALGDRASVPSDFGFNGSSAALDPLSLHRSSRLDRRPAAPDPSVGSTAAADETETAASDAWKNDLNIPFEQFKSIEEFRAWVKQQLAQPGGGIYGEAVRQGATPRSGVPAPPGATPPANAPNRNSAQLPPLPIGYAGVGSGAAEMMGGLHLRAGDDLHRQVLVAALNQYMQQVRDQREAQRRENLRRPGAPRSSLGVRSIDSWRLPPRIRPGSAQSLSGAQSTSGVRSRLPNTGLPRSELPSDPNAWLPPTAGLE